MTKRVGVAILQDCGFLMGWGKSKWGRTRVSMRGTTTITVLVIGDTLYVANVGDLRAVQVVKDGNHIVVEDLSSDHTPFWRDEYERVKLCGAIVLSVDQVEVFKDRDI
ncbi:phosphatase 2C 35 [Spatholobus suberectus]|nr:phosphatase 2C 35 [Spatholobus suberectus]